LRSSLRLCIENGQGDSGIPRLQRFNNISVSTWAVGAYCDSTTADCSHRLRSWKRQSTRS